MLGLIFMRLIDRWRAWKKLDCVGWVVVGLAFDRCRLAAIICFHFLHCFLRRSTALLALLFTREFPRSIVSVQYNSLCIQLDTNTGCTTCISGMRMHDNVFSLDGAQRRNTCFTTRIILGNNGYRIKLIEHGWYMVVEVLIEVVEKRRARKASTISTPQSTSKCPGC